jgi:hypothetical protein
MNKEDRMDAVRVYGLLQEACRALEQAEEHGIAAQVSYAMALVQRRYGVGQDHLPALD